MNISLRAYFKYLETLPLIDIYEYICSFQESVPRGKYYNLLLTNFKMWFLGINCGKKREITNF